MDQASHLFRVALNTPATQARLLLSRSAALGASGSGRRLLWIADGVALFLVAFAMLSLVSSYLAREHTFYIADSYFWPAKTVILARHFHEVFLALSPGAWLNLVRELWISTLDDYSQLYALPLAPFLSTFGYSRHVYMASVALVYTLPFAISLGILSTQLIPTHRRAAFWLGTGLALLTPTLWVATLRGYPDTVAGLLLCIAMFLYLRANGSRSRYLVLAGVFLALAILFRRHFIYSVAGFLAALALLPLLDLARDSWQRRRLSAPGLGRHIRQVSFVTVSTIVALGILGTPFLYSLLTFDYATQFNEAERMSTVETIWYYGTRFGWLAWLTAGTGFIAAIVTRAAAVPVALVIALSGGFATALWAVHARAPAAHHGLNFAVFIIIGQVALLWTISSKASGVLRVAALTGLGLYAMVNVGVALAFWGPSANTPAGGLLAAQYRPLARDDYDTVGALVNYLRGIATPEQPIYVVGTVPSFSFHTLGSAEETLYPERSLQLIGGLFRSHPISNVIQADYVIVPVETGVAEAQGCARQADIVRTHFAAGIGIGENFRPLPTEFILGPGDGYPQGPLTGAAGGGPTGAQARVRIYERVGPTGIEAALMTRNEMRAVGGSCSNQDPDWLVLSPRPDWIYVDRYDRYEFRTTGANLDDTDTTLVYMPDAWGDTTLRGRVVSTGNDCTPLTLQTLQSRDANGAAEYTPLDIDEQGQFEVANPPAWGSNRNLLLRVVGQAESDGPMANCPTRIELRKPVESGTVLARLAGRVADALRSRKTVAQ